VNTYTTNGQQDFSIALDADGNARFVPQPVLANGTG
jgi:hypothetical protein